MKKFFYVFSLLTFVFSLNVNAQTEKGTLLLGGNAAFISGGGESILTVNPNLGLFLADNFAAGLSATLITSDVTTIYGVGPYGRGYFGSSSSGKFFAQAGVNLIGTSGDFGSDSDFGWTIGAGYAIFLNPSVALELGPQYSKVGDSDGQFNINVGFQIHFKK